MGHLSRRATAAAAFATASTPALARATNMDGLFVVVVGMFVGIPAALILIVAILLMLASKGTGFARAMQFIAPLLGIVFPLVIVAFGSKTDFILTSLLFDAPVILLALIATVIAIRRARE